MSCGFLSICIMKLNIQKIKRNLTSHPPRFVLHGSSFHWTILESFVNNMLILLQTNYQIHQYKG